MTEFGNEGNLLQAINAGISECSDNPLDEGPIENYRLFGKGDITQIKFSD
jgi:hypothetical protein